VVKDFFSLGYTLSLNPNPNKRKDSGVLRLSRKKCVWSGVRGGDWIGRATERINSRYYSSLGPIGTKKKERVNKRVQSVKMKEKS
jgi:hypothetical protein